MVRPFLITGATGNVGRELVRELRERGATLRIAARHAGSAPEAITLDLTDPRTFGRALDGVGGVFLLRPPAISDTRHTLVPFVDEARRRSAGHIVFLSVAGAGSNPLVPHHAVERQLMRGRGWTILRPGFFAQNLTDAYRRDIIEDQRLFVPAGAGKVAFVDVRDVAQVAARVLADPATHDQRAYTLTGPAAVTFAEAAAILALALGRPIQYVPASVLAYTRHLHRRGLPTTQIVVQTILHLGLRFGQAARVDPTLATLLGHPGRTLQAFVADHVQIWRG